MYILDDVERRPMQRKIFDFCIIFNTSTLLYTILLTRQNPIIQTYISSFLK